MAIKTLGVSVLRNRYTFGHFLVGLGLAAIASLFYEAPAKSKQLIESSIF
jgi:hypothetical protein